MNRRVFTVIRRAARCERGTFWNSRCASYGTTAGNLVQFSVLPVGGSTDATLMPFTSDSLHQIQI